jgi:hypothetical protein
MRRESIRPSTTPGTQTPIPTRRKYTTLWLVSKTSINYVVEDTLTDISCQPIVLRESEDAAESRLTTPESKVIAPQLTSPHGGDPER